VAKKPAQYTMKSLEQVRILAHPLRLRLLENFAQSAQTTRQVAEKLGVPATRLYHHVNALEAVGLIRLKETRPVRGTIEKYYEAVAKKMIVGPGVFGESPGGLSEVLATVLDEARRDLETALAREQAENLQPLALRAILHGTPAQVAALRKKMLGLLKDLQGKKGKGAKAWITLVFAAESEADR
jgi:DNA-binding transcriptional ArsR family regulator